jgi:hypothetical protein
VSSHGLQATSRPEPQLAVSESAPSHGPHSVEMHDLERLMVPHVESKHEDHSPHSPHVLWPGTQPQMRIKTTCLPHIGWSLHCCPHTVRRHIQGCSLASAWPARIHTTLSTPTTPTRSTHCLETSKTIESLYHTQALLRLAAVTVTCSTPTCSGSHHLARVALAPGLPLTPTRRRTVISKGEEGQDDECEECQRPHGKCYRTSWKAARNCSMVSAYACSSSCCALAQISPITTLYSSSV